jgi:hypothetical protein
MARNATANLPCRSEGPEDIEIARQNVQLYLSTNDLTAITKPKCNHCFMLAMPDAHIELGIWKVSGTSAALAYRDIDPFIADYYNHLENDGFGLLTVDEKLSCYAHLRNILPNRAFFITRDGWMGLGIWSAKPGDQVVILSGASMPALLRSTGNGNWRPDLTDEANPALRYLDQCQVVGEAYVHVIMGGEAVKDFKWEKDYEVFDLV